MQAVRHYTRLSQKNFSIDTHFYPLGSCTMKYNPRACNSLAMLPGFLARHPLAPDSHGPGVPGLSLRAAGDAQRGDRHARGLAGAIRRRAGRVRRGRHDPRLSPGARRPGAHRDAGAGRRARHQSGLGGHVRLHGARDPDRPRRRCRSRRTERRRRSADRRHHAHQSEHGRRLRPQHPGDRAHRARGRRSALLRRRQSQRHPRQGPSGRHGLRRHPHEPAQDLLHPARRRRSGRGSGGRLAASGALPAGAAGRASMATTTAG